MHVTDSNNATGEGDRSVMHFHGNSTYPTDGGDQDESEVVEVGEKEAAAQKVFRMSETIEVVLDDLTAKELFQAVPISRTFLDTVATVPRFQQKMFLVPVKVYNNAEWDVDSEEELPEPVKLNPLIDSDEWTEDNYDVEMESLLGLDGSVDRCDYIFSDQVMPRTGMKCFSFVAFLTSKDDILRLGLGIPRPLTRTFLTQPAFRSGLRLRWPSRALTEMIRITGVTTGWPEQGVLARVDVMPCCIGDLLAVVRAVGAHEPSLDEWIRVFAGRGHTTIEVDKAVFPTDIQVLMCGNPTYMYFWGGRGN
ncbi:hypothetical protein PRZ48_008950 [Zasmidium cellare]|uniref:Uncharacterized protein n=1 Tax=Zasmidium cellare TaxID=395010 RepID=A0ABR0EHY7_ZASCE|nr:hypothetical protein PRZ48_008950 [Zasmidium cellare]